MGDRHFSVRIERVARFEPVLGRELVVGDRRDLIETAGTALRDLELDIPAPRAGGRSRWE